LKILLLRYSHAQAIQGIATGGDGEKDGRPGRRAAGRRVHGGSDAAVGDSHRADAARRRRGNRERPGLAPLYLYACSALLQVQGIPPPSPSKKKKVKGSCPTRSRLRSNTASASRVQERVRSGRRRPLTEQGQLPPFVRSPLASAVSTRRFATGGCCYAATV